MSEAETAEPEVDQEQELEPNHIGNFIDNVLDGSNSAAKDHFDNAIALKITQSLDTEKQNLASSLFNQEHENGQPQKNDAS